MGNGIMVWCDMCGEKCEDVICLFDFSLKSRVRDPQYLNIEICEECVKKVLSVSKERIWLLGGNERDVE